jgi:hypothetical protein
MKNLTYMLLLPLTLKVLVIVGPLFYADNDAIHTPNPSGTQVCAPLILKPWTLDMRAVVECGARTALTGPNICPAIKNLIIMRAFAEYGVTIVSDDIEAQGCPQ